MRPKRACAGVSRSCGDGLARGFAAGGKRRKLWRRQRPGRALGDVIVAGLVAEAEVQEGLAPLPLTLGLVGRLVPGELTNINININMTANMT